MEYLFRGKRIDNGEWVEGWLIGDRQPFIVKNFIIDYSILKTVKTINPKISDIIEVLPSSVGQFTGLKDKNGVKIFEGDIIKYKIFVNEKAYLGVIKYSNKSAAFYFDGDKGNNLICSRDEIEVIGNIFDNKELLEVKE